MGAFRDLAGKKRGMLYAIKRIGSDRDGNALWQCLCDCGNKTVVSGRAMHSGHTKSCGCWQKETIRRTNSLPRGISALNSRYSEYARVARKLKRSFELTKAQFRDISQGNCYYCGSPPRPYLMQNHNGPHIANGLDRMDPAAGYTMNNIVACCTACNIAKHTMTVDRFREWVAKVYEHFAKPSEA